MERLEHAKALMRSERPGLHVAGAAALARLAVLGEEQHIASGAAACLADAVVENAPVLRYVAARTAAAGKDAARRRRSWEGAQVSAARGASCDTTTAELERGAAVVSKLKIVLYSNDPCARAMAFSLLGTLAPVVSQGDDLEIWHAIWKALEGSDPTEVGAACIAMSALCGISEGFAEATLPRAVSRLRSMRTDCATASRIVPVMRTMHHNAALAFASQRACEQLIDDGIFRACTLRLTLEGLTELAMRAPGNVRAHQRLLHRTARFDERSAVRVTSLHCLRKLAMACAVASAHTVILDAVWFVRRIAPLQRQGHERDDDAVPVAERLATATMVERVLHHSRHVLRTFCADTSENDANVPSTTVVYSRDVAMEDAVEEKVEEDIPDDEGAENLKRDAAWKRRYLAELQSNLREATFPYRGGECELCLRFTCAIALLKVYAINGLGDLQIAAARDTCTTCFEILAECAALPIVRASMKRLATELVSTLTALVCRRANLQNDLYQLIVCALQQVISWAPRRHIPTAGGSDRDGRNSIEKSQGYEPTVFVVRVLVRCYSSIFSSFNEGIHDGDARGHMMGARGTAAATSATMMLMLEPIERCIDMLTRVSSPDIRANMPGDTSAAATVLELPGETEVRIMTPLARFCIEAYVRASKGVDGRYMIELNDTGAGTPGGLPHAQRFSGQIKRRVINIARRLMALTNLNGTDRQCGSAIVSIYMLGMSCLCCNLYQAAHALLDITAQHVTSEWNVAWIRGLQLIAEAGIVMEGSVVSRNVVADGDTAMDDIDNVITPRAHYAFLQNGTDGNSIAVRLASSVDYLRNAEESISNALRLSPREFRTERIRTLTRLVRLRYEQQRLMRRLTADVFVLLSSFAHSGVDMDSIMGELVCDRSRESLVADFMGIVHTSLQLHETLDDIRTACASPPPGSRGVDGIGVVDEDEDSFVEYRIVSAMTGCIAHAVATCIENTYTDERHSGDAGLCTDCVVQPIAQPLRNVLWEWCGGLKVQAVSEKTSKALLVYNALIGRKSGESAPGTTHSTTADPMPGVGLCSLSELARRVLEGTDIAAKATVSTSATTLTALHRLAASAACVRCRLPKWLV